MDNFTNQPRRTHDTVPAEDFSLNFEEIKVTYSDPNHDKWIDILSW